MVEHISLLEALKEYPWSRATLFRFADRGLIRKYKRPGTHRLYLDRRELDRLNRPQPLQQQPATAN